MEGEVDPVFPTVTQPSDMATTTDCTSAVLGTRPRRQSLPPTQQLEERTDDLRSELATLLIDMENVPNISSQELRTLAVALKSTLLSYREANLQLHHRMTRDARTSEAKTLLDQRNNIKDVVGEARREIDVELQERKEEQLSLFDMSALSVVHGDPPSTGVALHNIQEVDEYPELLESLLDARTTPNQLPAGPRFYTSSPIPPTVLSAFADPFNPTVTAPSSLPQADMLPLATCTMQHAPMISHLSQNPAISECPPSLRVISPIRTPKQLCPPAAIAPHLSMQAPPINPPETFTPYHIQPPVTHHFNACYPTYGTHPMAPGHPALIPIRPPVPPPVSSCVATMSPADTAPLAMRALTQCLTQQDYMKRGIATFDGLAADFRDWAAQIRQYVIEYDLTAPKIRHLLESHTKGDPLDLIKCMCTLTSEVTVDLIESIWQNLFERYRSAECVAADLKSRLAKHPVIKAPNLSAQLYRLKDLCSIVHRHFAECPEFIQLDFSDGLEIVKKKLPLDIRTKWDKFGKRHQEQYHRHPQFIRFIEFLGSQARQATYVGYQTIVENPAKSSLKFKTL